MLRIQWLLLMCLILSGTHCLVSATNKSCSPAEFACNNGRCVNMAYKCDGENDCLDHSDEAGCPSITCSDNDMRCGDGKCIPRRWACDGSSDCSDDSDEDPKMCNNETCDGYKCKLSNLCILNEWKCDGNPDCPNEDDEKGCIILCDPATEFRCNDSKCIAEDWRCDGREDCDDGSDEEGCSKAVCDTAAGEKMCNDGSCISEMFWCDGDIDCKDRSDEKNCTSKELGQNCSSNEFQCHLPLLDVQCIHIGWRCDGDEDCSDHSDELNCTSVSCKADEKLCSSSSVCIKATYFCDGDNDCDDGEDERNCSHAAIPVANKCKANEFDCGNNKCISDQLLCNHADDCGNGADEELERHCPIDSNNMCTKNNGGCSQVCVPTTVEPSGRKCECLIGFDFRNDSETECDDIDECQIPGTCSQACKNTKGSYKCECFPGYTLVNHRYCKANQGHGELILSDRHDIRSYHLDTFHYSRLLEEAISGAVAMDFDIRSKTVFWTDVQMERVCLANLESKEPKVIVKDNIKLPDGLAVDWVHKNLYLSDTGLDKIEVARIDGLFRKTLVTDDLDEPRALVLDPSNGWMYWTDWGSKPKIEKCGMNGQNRTAIVTEGIHWPNGLTIDYLQGRLYWVDAKLHSIGSSDLDGNNFKLILKNHRNLGHPFAITVFEDYLYWTDWMSNAVHRFSKFGRDNVSTVAFDLKSPMAIHVYHIHRQPDFPNTCGDNNGGCSHLCLPMPQTKVSSIKRSECACPDDMILDGNFICKQSFVSTTKKLPLDNDSTRPDESQTTNRPISHSTEAKATTATSTEARMTSDSVTEETSTGAEYPASKHVELEHNGEKSGYIAGIAIGSLLFIGLAAVGVVYLLLRRHKSRNVKSMNFDNPVYRKTTTEEQLIMEKNGSRSNLPQSMQPLNQDNDIV